MKYIDADKLIAEIERLLKCTEQHRGEAVADGSRQTLYWIQNFIDSLQQEQPEGLDEAAEEYAYNNWEDNDYHTGASEGLPFDAIGHTEKCFKAGAEWMAIQLNK